MGGAVALAIAGLLHYQHRELAQQGLFYFLMMFVLVLLLLGIVAATAAFRSIHPHIPVYFFVSMGGPLFIAHLIRQIRVGKVEASNAIIAKDKLRYDTWWDSNVQPNMQAIASVFLSDCVKLCGCVFWSLFLLLLILVVF